MMKFIDSIGKEGCNCTVTRNGNSNAKCRYLVETGNDKEHFEDLLEEEQEKALNWLYFNVLSAKKKLDGHTSYGMKHLLEDRTKIYMTNNQFKEAMLICGFFPTEPDELNWHFCIRRSSPMFQYQVDGKPGLPMLGDPMDYSSQWPKKESSDGITIIDMDV